MAPRPRTSPMAGHLFGERLQMGAHVRADARRARAQALGLDDIEHRVRGRDAQGIAAVGAAESAGMRANP